MKNPHPMARRAHRAFTLVEVAFALGLLSFCLVALVALATVGLRTQSESQNELRAVHVLSSMLNERVSLPLVALSGNPLPTLEQDHDNLATPVYLDESGGVVAGWTEGAQYRLHYEVEQADADPSVPTTAPRRMVRLHAVLLWPALPAAVNYTQALIQAQGRQETTTYVRIP
jgi:uncharacterized protein (TIGR02598 family)